MTEHDPKSHFKAKESAVVITDTDTQHLERHTKPAPLEVLKGSVLSYDAPLESVAVEDWEALQ